MTCTWEPDPACLGDQWGTHTPEVQERALRLATLTLQMLTRYRVGLCPITIRPCPPVARCGCGWNPHIRNGSWFNSCGCAGSCAPLSEYDIPGPVGYIDTMKIDGVDVDLWNGDWRIDDGTKLVWQGDGPSPLPAYQDLNLPDTEPGTWSITYSRSYPVSQDGKVAVALLALEYAEACKPRGKCSLPKNVRNVNRNGVSFTIEAGLFPNGLTSIQLVDAYILQWAPIDAPLRSARVFDPRSVSPRVSSPVPMRPPLGSL